MPTLTWSDAGNEFKMEDRSIMFKKIIVSISFFLILITCGYVDAETEIVEYQIKPSGSDPKNYLGSEMGIDGDYAIVGVKDDDDLGWNSGAAYIFKKEGSAWVEQAKLRASDGGELQYFGSRVCISGEYAMSMGGGRIYIYKREGSTWIEHQKLSSLDVQEDAYFRNIAIDGDALVIGAARISDGYYYVYVFRRDGSAWVEQAKLLPPEDEEEIRGEFNSSVAINGDYIVVGNAANYIASSSGNISREKACIFKKDGDSWILQAELTPSDNASGCDFGERVAIDGDYAVVGASSDDEYDWASGAVYIFKREGDAWTQQAKLVSPDPGKLKFFGSHLAIEEEHLAIWEMYRTGPVNMLNMSYTPDEESGVVYIYKRWGDVWREKTRLRDSDELTPGYFGNPFAMDGDTIFLWGWQYSGSQSLARNEPVVYIYEMGTCGEEIVDEEITLRGFDKEHYLTQVLTYAQSFFPFSPFWMDKTVAELDCYFRSEGASAEFHYSNWGYIAEMSPNPYFNHSEYILAISKRLVEGGVYPTMEDAEASVRSNWSGDFYIHYLRWGAASGLNPCDDFDESQYLSDKLAALQADGTWIGGTVDELRDYFTSTGITVLEHYLLNGAAEGLTPKPVPDDKRAGD